MLTFVRGVTAVFLDQFVLSSAMYQQIIFYNKNNIFAMVLISIVRKLSVLNMRSSWSNNEL